MNTKVITGFIAGASLDILTGILIARDSGKNKRTNSGHDQRSKEPNGWIL